MCASLEEQIPAIRVGHGVSGLLLASGEQLKLGGRSSGKEGGSVETT
jgi:hypothetical protein